MTVMVMWAFLRLCVLIMTVVSMDIFALTMEDISGENSADQVMGCMTARWVSCICGAAGIC